MLQDFSPFEWIQDVRCHAKTTSTFITIFSCRILSRMYLKFISTLNQTPFCHPFAKENVLDHIGPIEAEPMQISNHHVNFLEACSMHKQFILCQIKSFSSNSFIAIEEIVLRNIKIQISQNCYCQLDNKSKLEPRKCIFHIWIYMLSIS